MSDNPIIRKLFHLAFLLKRPVTLGVRVLALNEKGEILLVKHTYVKGWYLPGGGVEIGETSQAAAGKELLEETGYQVKSELELLSSYYNTSASKRDHVLLYHCKAMDKIREFMPNREIKEIGFFPLDQLPEGTTKSTLRRIKEHLKNEPISEYW